MSIGRNYEVLAPQLGAGSSIKFKVADKRSVTLMTDNDLAGVETVKVEISHDGGTTFKTYKDGNGDVELTTSKNSLQLHGPAVYRATKTATVSSTGIFIQR